MRETQPTNTTLLDAALIPSWIFCPHTLRFMYVNDAAVNTYGYSKEEFNSMTLKDLRPEGDIQHLLDSINTGVRPDVTRPHTSRWRHRHKDGSLFYVELYASYIEYNDCAARLVQAININDKVIDQQQRDTINAVLREQKDALDYVLASIKDVVWIAYADNFQLLYTNDACENVHGYTAAEMIADKSLFFNSIYPEDLPAFMDSFQKMMATGSDDREFRIIHKDGSIRHLRGTCILRKGRDGERDMCCGLTVDITELKKEQQRTDNILNSITDGFFVLDKDWKFTYVNQAYKNMFDSTTQTVEGKAYWELFPVAKEQKFFTEYNRAIAENTSVHFEEYSTSLQKWVKVSAYPLNEGLAIYFTDINEEKMLKDAIIRQEQNLNALINNTEDLIWSVDTDHKILSVNRACQEYVFTITGKWPEPGQPTAVNDMPDAMRDHWLTNYKRALAGESFKITNEVDMPGNKVQHWETSFYQIRDGKGNITGISCFCTNITDIRNHMMQIEMQNERLKEIAHVQSHQVRGPVATIMGLQQLINTENPADPLNTQILSGIQNACDALDTMIRNIDKKTRAVWAEV